MMQSSVKDIFHYTDRTEGHGEVTDIVRAEVIIPVNKGIVNDG